VLCKTEESEQDEVDGMEEDAFSEKNGWRFVKRKTHGQARGDNNR